MSRAKESVERVEVPLQVSLNKELYEKLCENSKNPNKQAALTSHARWFLEAYASGGIMLSSTQVQTLERTTDQKFETAEEIIKAIQKSAGREDGNYTIKAQIDPVYWTPLEERARENGESVQWILTSLLNECLTNGWYYDFQADYVLRFTKEDYAELRKLVGNDVVRGRDVVEALKAQAVTA